MAQALRRRFWLRSSALALLASLTCATMAHAGDMDPAPERLIRQPAGLPAGSSCQAIAADPEIAVGAGLSPGSLACLPDDVAFANMVAELGFAAAPSAMYPARTTGYAGFTLGIETSATKLNSAALSRSVDGKEVPYWERGSRGPGGRGVNPSPNDLLMIYALHARKGLPWGLEIGGSLGFIGQTSLFITGADLRWSVLEGFRQGALRYLPDLSFGGGLRTVTGSTSLHLTTIAFDTKLSKPFPVLESTTLEPYLGFQRLFVFGDSNVVDLTPNVDALKSCGYAGADPTTGFPACQNKLSNGEPNSGDFNNNASFQSVRAHRNRGIVGLAYRYELLHLGTQLAFDLTPPNAENPGLSSLRQWTLSFEAGIRL